MLIVGAGFGGIGCAKELAKHRDLRVTLDDGQTVAADYLVLAGGSQPNFLPRPGAGPPGTSWPTSATTPASASITTTRGSWR